MEQDAQRQGEETSCRKVFRQHESVWIQDVTLGMKLRGLREPFMGDFGRTSTRRDEFVQKFESEPGLALREQLAEFVAMRAEGDNTISLACFADGGEGWAYVPWCSGSAREKAARSMRSFPANGGKVPPMAADDFGGGGDVAQPQTKSRIRRVVTHEENVDGCRNRGR